MVTWFGFWIRVVISFILTGYSEFLCKNTNKDTSLLFKMSFTTLCADSPDLLVSLIDCPFNFKDIEKIKLL